MKFFEEWKRGATISAFLALMVGAGVLGGFVAGGIVALALNAFSKGLADKYLEPLGVIGCIVLVPLMIGSASDQIATLAKPISN